MSFDTEIPLLDVPIYLEPKAQFNAVATLRENKDIETFLQNWRPLGSTPSQHDFEAYTRTAVLALGGPWDFNQIIGWYRLFAERRALRGDYWAITATRLRRDLARKRYLLRKIGAFRIHVFGEQNSAAIQARLLCQIKAHTHRVAGSERWVDCSRLESLGPFVDWARVVSTVSR